MDSKQKYTRGPLSVISLVMLGLCLAGIAEAEDMTKEETTAHYQAYWWAVVDAIYVAEGGKAAKVPYGILSVKVSGEAEARRVCYNTVKNNWYRWDRAGRKGLFIDFLGSKYAPIGTKNDPKNLNKNWIRSVKYYCSLNGYYDI